jgi:lipid-A-disaccharide synthase-like uncharacterized protein
MRLTAPTPTMFWVSAALAVAAALVYFLQVDIPVIKDHVFIGLMAAYVILALANIVRGL